MANTKSTIYNPISKLEWRFVQPKSMPLPYETMTMTMRTIVTCSFSSGHSILNGQNQKPIVMVILIESPVCIAQSLLISYLRGSVKLFKRVAFTLHLYCVPIIRISALFRLMDFVFVDQPNFYRFQNSIVQCSSLTCTNKTKTEIMASGWFLIYAIVFRGKVLNSITFRYNEMLLFCCFGIPFTGYVVYKF